MKFDLNNINTIIFDLGGVVLNLDIPRSANAFAELANISAEEVFELFMSNPVFLAFERGEVNPEVFRDEIRILLKRDLSDLEIDKAWNSMLADLPTDRLKVLAQLQDRFETIILSNTNPIHINSFNSIVDEATGGQSIDNYFSTVYYSHLLGMRKPDTEIFEYVLNQHKLTPASTLFIDDMPANTTAASTLGIQAWHLTDQQDLITVFGNE